MTADLNPGDRVNWTYAARGGYCLTTKVAAVVVRPTGKKVTIRVARKVGSGWVQENRLVSRDKLTPRTSTCPELGE